MWNAISMELFVQNGGQAVQPGMWMIFPVGWPGPGVSYGVVRSVGEKSAMVYDIFFDMNMEFMLDRIELLTPERMSAMTPNEKTFLERARRQMSGEEVLPVAA